MGDRIMKLREFSVVIPAVCAMLLFTGCAAFRQSVNEDVDVDKEKAMSAKYDAKDLHKMSDEVVDKLLEDSFIQGLKEPPMVAIFGVENKTTIYVDTQAMTDTIRRKLRDAKKMRFVNTARRDDLNKEQAYQGKNTSAENRVAMGKQAGAKYMLTGSFSEITTKSGRQVRVSAKEQVFYQLTVEITDLETGEIVAECQVERTRKESKPLIGW